MRVMSKLEMAYENAKELFNWSNTHATLIEDEQYNQIHELYLLLKDEVDRQKELEQSALDKIEKAELPKYKWENGGFHFELGKYADKSHDVDILSGMCSAYRDIIDQLLDRLDNNDS